MAPVDELLLKPVSVLLTPVSVLLTPVSVLLTPVSVLLIPGSVALPMVVPLLLISVVPLLLASVVPLLLAEGPVLPLLLAEGPVLPLEEDIPTVVSTIDVLPLPPTVGTAVVSTWVPGVVIPGPVDAEVPELEPLDPSVVTTWGGSLHPMISTSDRSDPRSMLERFQKPCMTPLYVLDTRIRDRPGPPVAASMPGGTRGRPLGLLAVLRRHPEPRAIAGPAGGTRYCAR